MASCELRVGFHSSSCNHQSHRHKHLVMWKTNHIIFLTLPLVNIVILGIFPSIFPISPPHHVTYTSWLSNLVGGDLGPWQLYSFSSFWLSYAVISGSLVKSFSVRQLQCPSMHRASICCLPQFKTACFIFRIAVVLHFPTRPGEVRCISSNSIRGLYSLSSHRRPSFISLCLPPK